MTALTNAPRVAVIGPGAVGSYFGGMLARAGGQVTFLGRPGKLSAALAAIEKDGLLIDSLNFKERVRVGVSADPAAVRDAEIVLFAVKTFDNEAAARGVAPHLRPGALVLCLQNGIENVQQISGILAPGTMIVPTVVYVAAAILAPGHLRHGGRGDLVIGAGPVAPPAGALERVAAMFETAGVPCRVEKNIEGEMWFKLVWNCAGNAISALGRASYGLIGSLEPARELMTQAAQEVLAVARAAGIRMPDVDAVSAGLKVARAFGAATSSTSQDIERGRPTEIDSLNGVIVRRGAELGVPTPANRALWALVKLLEASNAERQAAAASSAS